ncbi:MAG: aminomethyl-transferring glycine dehydrogenase [Prolixibacteraceae bacterium]|jgi:glycine dehydrogenase|nr:aminomethyl-transferring glycine dehydrogenase [Prolixibacteraceae bacterium]
MPYEKFIARHIGPRDHEIDQMLGELGVASMDEFIDQTVPKDIRIPEMKLTPALSERAYFKHIKALASKNKVFNTYIGMGYYDTITPAVILRNVLENPAWYTSYTPYQAEISQGRLEALLNFQTMVAELTAMELANASLLDEGTAGAEAMIMMFHARGRKQKHAVKCFVDEMIWPQTLDVLVTRAEHLGIELVVGDFKTATLDDSFFGAVIQYPNSDGVITDYSGFTASCHEKNIRVAVATDLMALTVLQAPGEWDADIVFGSSQRFGIPMGYGGPAAAFFATKEEMKRTMPGRIIGITKDAQGNQALRMALQTREQHIKRERATSNICTAQALLATMSGMFGTYHGPEGLIQIATRIHTVASFLSEELNKMGYQQLNKTFFDTLRIALPAKVKKEDIEWFSLDLEMNFRYFDNGDVGIAIDETTNLEDINWILEVFAKAANLPKPEITEFPALKVFEGDFKRASSFMQQTVFNRYRSETEMARYIKRLERKDISLLNSMISLGSCTMKLNAATEMLPLSWIEFGGLHPFVPKNQALGYHEMMEELRRDLSVITGFADMSMQPNSGAAGEYAGLMVIREYHKRRGEGHRNIVLIPASAHGTNPASGVMAGLKVVVTPCDENGNVDVEALRAKAVEHKDDLAAIMITYPSTHGIFEVEIREICNIIHENGGQVYMDGANMNAQVGLTNPGFIGADVCHLNLHKTFAIPHGGGGPGVGPIGVAKHLVECLPSHSVINNGHVGIHAVSSAPWGSALVQTITYGYIKMMGADGLKKATEVAILNANYIAHHMKDSYGVLYTGAQGRVGHELILECRGVKASAGITESDVAKRLMDYGFHAPTLSFPVHGTLMIEPTESESKYELDRFIETLNSIFKEIKEIESGEADAEDNVLKNAPHTDKVLTADEWPHAYPRSKAAYPLEWLKDNKFWVPVGRVDDAYGDRNLVCSCDPIESYM